MKTLSKIFAVLALSIFAGQALAAEFVDYKPGLIKQELAAGKTVFVDYKASWCSTCAAQERVINNLMQSNPAYAEKILFVGVDWDKFGRHDVTTSRNVPRRSTLILLRGDKELGRIVASTREADIKALMDMGL